MNQGGDETAMTDGTMTTALSAMTDTVIGGDTTGLEIATETGTGTGRGTEVIAAIGREVMTAASPSLYPRGPRRRILEAGSSSKTRADLTATMATVTAAVDHTVGIETVRLGGTATVIGIGVTESETRNHATAAAAAAADPANPSVAPMPIRASPLSARRPLLTPQAVVAAPARR